MPSAHAASVATGTVPAAGAAQADVLGADLADLADVADVAVREPRCGLAQGPGPGRVGMDAGPTVVELGGVSAPAAAGDAAHAAPGRGR